MFGFVSWLLLAVDVWKQGQAVQAGFEGEEGGKEILSYQGENLLCAP